MKDLDQRLLEGLREMGATAEPPPGLFERARGRMVAYRRRVRIGAALVALATLVAAVTVLPVVNRRAREGRQGTTSTVAGVPADPEVGHWAVLGTSPLVIDEQGAALSIWTGDNVIVWAEAEAAGARLDPATGRWRRVANSPLTPRQGASAIWTGKEMLVWGGRSGDRVATDPGAAYDPVTDAWRPLPRPPIRLRAGHSVVWTGTEMLVWGGAGNLPRPPHFADGAAYDPATDRWRRLPQAPLLRRAGHSAVWTGREMVVWGGGETAARVTSFADGAAFDPGTQSWRPLPPSPLVSRSAHTAVWSGAQLLVWAGRSRDGPISDGASWDPATGDWSPLPVAPLGPRAQHTAVWSGTEMIVWGGAGAGRRRFADGAAYNPTRGAWRRLPGVLLSSRFDHASTWTGSAMFVWGGRAPGDRPPADGALFRLGPAPKPAPGAKGAAAGSAKPQPSRDTADSPCLDKRRAQPTPVDVERFVEGFMRLRTIGTGAEECLSSLALRQYRPDLAARRDLGSEPPPLCLYECGRAVVVGLRRDDDWLRGRSSGAYTATVKVVLEQPNGAGGVTEHVIEEIITVAPGQTWSGRSARLVVQQATTSPG
ncbi:MAG TPA: hypothetical protein VNA57_14610 [Acidimicrobiales bacterium]|nr:hypothetical protein [Acidimicrobiales bacterium]